jgi:DNA-binding YbaB/EbfC family protein
MGPLKGGLQKLLLEQVQKVQQNLVKTQEELANERVEATAGGGMVTAVATGIGEIVEIRIAREAVDPDDVELLQDTVLAAVREAIAKAKQHQAERMQAATGGLSIPGLF